MSPEPRSVSEPGNKQSLGSLSGCLVDGDAEQLTRQRQVKRRALAISISLQSAVLAALVLVPLFSKAERIALTIVTPIPPYSAHHGTTERHNARHPHPQQNTCRFCPPPSIPNTIVTRDNSTTQAVELPGDDIGLNIPGAPDGQIPLYDSRPRGPEIPRTETRIEPRVLHITRLDPAMLQRRVEPAYPALARQIHREGRVELRATIGTDGSIQSLQVVTGDPLFVQSALQAVQQWHYKPTYLNGQAMEVDTYITVVYTLHQ